MSNRLRLLIDDSAAFNQGAGIGRYARNLLPSAARRLCDTDITLWYAPSSSGEAPFADQTLSPFSDQQPPTVRRSPLSRRRMDQLWFRARLPLPIRLLAGRADLIYSPDFTAPLDLRTPRIVTIHDLAFLICPERTSTPLRRYLTSVVPTQAADAARVIAVSESTRTDLIKHLHTPPDRITVVPNGVEDRFFQPAPLDDTVRRQLGLPSNYLLTVGTLEPRKNHLTLFSAIRHQGNRLGLPLVVAGRPGWDYEPILYAAEPLRQSGQVILLDYVPDDLLPGLYAGAAAMIYPSWYEGFGLPVLEALAVGTPVVASDVPALREVAGDSALYAPPASAETLADAIQSALEADQQSAMAREQRQYRARRYSWDDAGRKLAFVLAEVADRPDVLVEESSAR